MSKKHSKRDHTLADRSYLRGYISSILSIENGAFQLGSMISNAESAAELLNYDRKHIGLATRAMLKQVILGSPHNIAHSGIGKFAKTLRKDPELYDSFTRVFRRAISETLPTISSGDQREYNLAILEALVKEHPQLKGSWEKALSVEREAQETIKKVASTGPTERQPV